MNIDASRLPTVLVIHTNAIVRTGVIAALKRHGLFQVLEDGIEAVEHWPATDVVIAEYADAVRLAERRTHFAQRVHAEARILTLTSNAREVDVRRAVECGVHGYLLVGGSLDELVDGVTAVARGLRYMSPSVAHRMAESLTRATLTSRELEVLRLVVIGQPNKLIARELDIELATVKSHVSAIMSKLGARSRTEAARIASSRGLVDEESRFTGHSPTRSSQAETGLQPA